MWVMVEPRFEKPEMGMPIEGAKDTFFVPGREVEGYPGIQPYTRAEFKKLGLGWDSFYEKASAAAARMLLKVEPKWVKDEASRVKYAAISSERPIVAGLITAPNFVRRFEATLGPRLVVFVPDRYHMFVFSDNPDVYTQYTMAMAARFEDSPFSASREVFLWQKGAKKPKVIGSVETK